MEWIQSIADSSLGSFVSTYYDTFLTLHILAMSIGIGAATLTDVLFFRFLKDYKLTQWESETLNVMSKVIWTVLPLIVVTGFLVLLPQSERLLSNPGFLMKMTIIAVIILNGINLNFIAAPKMLQVFGGTPITPKLRNMRRLSFSFGAISATSWYSAFVLGSMYRVLNYNYSTLFLIYLGLLTAAICVSQIAEAGYNKKSIANVATEPDKTSSSNP